MTAEDRPNGDMRRETPGASQSMPGETWPSSSSRECSSVPAPVNSYVDEEPLDSESGDTNPGEFTKSVDVHSGGPTKPNRSSTMTRHEQRNSRPGSGLLVMFPLIAVVCGLVWMGPIIIERYQYAATKGRIRAEYEVAANMLEDQPLSNVSMAFQLVAQKVSPSVVKIHAGSRAGDRMFSAKGGQGSGIVFSADGYIMTNLHVIKDAVMADPDDRRIVVGFSDRSREPAQIVGYDELTDLAVLKVNRTDLIPADWGDSNGLKVGSMVWAIGSPYGYENSVTAGIVSGRNRQGKAQDSNVSQLQEFIQTDAAVNPGNSGGPLVDSQGRVVGINTQIFGEIFQGISFAIPSADAKFVFDELLEHGKVRRGYLGVRLTTDEFFINPFSLASNPIQGARVDYVRPNEPANRAGLEPGDIVTEFDGIEIHSFQQLYHQISVTPPGREVNLAVVRDGIDLELSARIGDRERFFLVN